MSIDVCKIIAQDLVDSALSANIVGSQFPMPASEFFAYVSPKDLLPFAEAVRDAILGGFVPNFFLGYSMLFYLNRDIDVAWKPDVFSKIVQHLRSLRVDFSQHSGVVLRSVPHYTSLGEDGTAISISEYRKIVFLLDNYVEIRVPYYRGWAFDVFSVGDRVYRVYNMGTLKSPMFVILAGDMVKPPTADVFGHIFTAERVKHPVLVSPIANLQEHLVDRISNTHIGDTPREAVSFVLDAWSRFFDLPKVPPLLSPRYALADFQESDRDKYIRAAYRYVRVLLGGKCVV